MTAGGRLHKHWELRVRRHSLFTRLLTHPLVFSDDLERVDASPYPWGPIAGPSDPVPLMPDGQPAPKHLTWHSTPPGSWYLSGLSVLHRWSGMVLRIPDHETDGWPSNEQVDRIERVLTSKLLSGQVPVFIDTSTLVGIVRQVVADTLLIARGSLTVEDFECHSTRRGCTWEHCRSKDGRCPLPDPPGGIPDKPAAP